MTYLTKTRFKVALECPTRLRYLDSPDYLNQLDFDEFMLALAEGGHRVGALAKCMFPGGVEVTSVGHDAQVAETRALLDAGHNTIFEAAFRHDRLFIRADVLRRNGDVLELYEVKSKGYDPTKGEAQIVGAKGGIKADFKPYLYDAAFQRHVLRLVFPGITVRTHLVMPNKAAVCDEPQLAQRLHVEKRGRQVVVTADPTLADGRLARALLHVLPVDHLLDRLEGEPVVAGGRTFAFVGAIQAFTESLDGEFLPPRLGSHCKSCPFQVQGDQVGLGKRDGRKQCLSETLNRPPEDFDSGTVLDLSNFRRTDDLIAGGKHFLVELEPEDLNLDEEDNGISTSHRQWLQCEEARGVIEAPYVRTEAVRAELGALTPPLHFIDFETSRPTLPYHAGHGPYEQLLFQFSHHIVDVDGTVRHVSQFLHDTPGALPSFDVLRELQRALGGDNGSVLHWWDHERVVLKDVRSQLEAASDAAVPDKASLIDFIDSLVGAPGRPARLFDLGRLFLRTVFLPGTDGRSSLKRVLPALLRLSPVLEATYSPGNYGSQGGPPSHNYRDFQWFTRNEHGEPRNPYALLGQRFDDPALADAPDMEHEFAEVDNGGAAMVAYALLQDERLSDDRRAILRGQLLRYCELDSLAMVMAWQALDESLGAD